MYRRLSPWFSLSLGILNLVAGRPAIALEATWTTVGQNVTMLEWQVPTYDFPSLGSQRLDEQLALYTHYLATEGTPDILIVGSSRSLQGVDPEALQTALVAQGYPHLKIYNFSINGATAQVIDLVLQDVLTAEQLPRLILWADGSRAFNSGRVDATYQAITASVGYAQLMEGDRPIQYNDYSQMIVTASSEIPCLDVVLPVAPSQPTAKPSPASIEASERLRSLSSTEEGIELPPAQRPNTAPTVGYYPTIEPYSQCQYRDATAPIAQSIPTWMADLNLIPPLPNTQLTTYGFLPVWDQFNPSLYYQQFPRVAGQYDGSYVPFELDGEQTDATITLANFARDRQIPLVFVNLPLSQDYLDAARQSYEAQFEEHMQRLASQYSFYFINFNQPELRQNSYFADPSHINAQGAQAVSNQLATRSDIPWNMP
jgi:lysophospholipase L1-like esterase